MLAALMVAPRPWFGVALAGALGGSVLVTARRRIVAWRRTRITSEGGATVLGRDPGGRPVAVSDSQLAAHGLILGATGAGKSTTLARILCDRIGRGLPVVALDLKGSPTFARGLADAAARAGRPCAVWSLDGGVRWNPLAHGNATELKDKLIATERFTEPHYRRAAERYLQIVLTVLSARQPIRATRLNEVVALCEPRRLAAAARGLPRPLRDHVTDYVSGLTPDQISAVRGLGTRLAIITESHVGELLAPGGASGAAELDLRSALRGDVVGLFSLNSSRYGSLAAQIGTMAVQDLVSAAGARLGELGGGGPASTAAELGCALVAIDEFSALGAEQVLALFARGREAGISVLLATQELTDLDRPARGLRDQVIGNTALKIVHRQDVPASARAVAEMIGTEPVWEETHHFGATSGRGALGPRGTRRQIDRFRVHPDAIASLPIGAAVLIAKVPQAAVQVVQVAAPAPTVGTAPSPPTAARTRSLVAAVASPAARTARSSSPPARSAPARQGGAAPPQRDRQGPEIG